jgi:probable addiction module antidote protein
LKGRFEARGAADATGEMAMGKPTKVDDLPEFDAASYLNSAVTVASYLTDILETNDSSLFSAALGEIARARGMTEIAKLTRITHEALYKALRPEGELRLDTVSRICAALGVRLVVQPIHGGVG